MAGELLQEEGRALEMRSPSGKLLGKLYPAAGVLEVRRGGRCFEIDLVAATAGQCVVFERVLHPAAGDQ